MNQVQELSEAIKTLDLMIETMKTRGKDFAHARREYEIAKAGKMLDLKESGIAMTTTLDLAKGDPHVAALRLDKDVAETLYKTVQEAIQTQKLKIRIMEAQLQRDWGRS
jgi:hypothetical protein